MRPAATRRCGRVALRSVVSRTAVAFESLHSRSFARQSQLCAGTYSVHVRIQYIFEYIGHPTALLERRGRRGFRAEAELKRASDSSGLPCRLCRRSSVAAALLVSRLRTLPLPLRVESWIVRSQSLKVRALCPAPNVFTVHNTHSSRATAFKCGAFLQQCRAPVLND